MKLLFTAAICVTLTGCATKREPSEGGSSFNPWRATQRLFTKREASPTPKPKAAPKPQASAKPEASPKPAATPKPEAPAVERRFDSAIDLTDMTPREVQAKLGKPGSKQEPLISNAGSQMTWVYSNLSVIFAKSSGEWRVMKTELASTPAPKPTSGRAKKP